jgi:alpha-D-ribose 1-methylphosphonate 5-triphosphate synthase subunit PhnG
MNFSPTHRQAWMRLLALSSWDDLKACTDGFAATPCDMIRPPETGLVMLRGRIGGTGSAFNLGEATVTRCAVRTAKCHDGHAYVMGRNHGHAKLAAVCDALLQDESQHAEIDAQVLQPLQKRMEEQRSLAAHKAAATKVDFFTLVRGEND